MSKEFKVIKGRGIYVLYHLPSSRIFEITEELYQTLKEYLNGEKDANSRINGILDMLNELEPLTKVYPLQGKRLGRVSFLSTQSCNLACRYCFANYGEYSGSHQKLMPFSIYKKTLDYLLNEYPDGVQLFQFFGGEPLLGFDEIKKFIPYCLEKFNELNLAAPTFSVVTNGTVFTEDMINVFNQYGVHVVVSMDGPKELNDLTRITPGGWSVFDKIESNLRWVNPKRRFTMTAEMTVTKMHLDRYEPGLAKQWMNSIRELGFDGVTVGVAETEEEKCKITEDYKDIYYQFEQEIIDYFIDQMTESDDFISAEIIAMIKALSSHNTALPCGAGYYSLSVTTEGDVLPCYQFHGHHEFDMGNVDGLVSENVQKIKSLFMDIEKTKPQECTKCWLNNICSVWCKGFGFNKSGNISTLCKTRCWISEAGTERLILNLARLQKDPSMYQKFKKNIFKMNEKFKYNS